ncbi:MAG: hypothetical protein NDJ19_00740 [Ramlibacter sp.]|nr:hypothetical protein [Ramlibacter sp.]
MMVARWSIDAKFGYKQNVVDMMQRWLRDIAPKVGIKAEQTRLLTGSVGALEASVVSEHVIENLGELNKVWDQLAALPEHKKWGQELEPYVVSGTSRWEIFRLI